MITLSAFMFSFFFFNDTSPTEIYTLSLHDALPIYRFRDLDERWKSASTGRRNRLPHLLRQTIDPSKVGQAVSPAVQDRKSTRLNSSHQIISYAVFCLKKKNKKTI